MNEMFRAGDELAHIVDDLRNGALLMDQWFDECLIAISQMKNSQKYQVVELPPRAIQVRTVKRNLGTVSQAERYIERNYGHMETIIVQPEELPEEIERRRLVKAQDESDEDRLERQAQAHLETAALHRDDPLF
jgi:hypothetical protein